MDGQHREGPTPVWGRHGRLSEPRQHLDYPCPARPCGRAPVQPVLRRRPARPSTVVHPANDGDRRVWDASRGEYSDAVPPPAIGVLEFFHGPAGNASATPVEGRKYNFPERTAAHAELEQPGSIGGSWSAATNSWPRPRSSCQDTGPPAGTTATTPPRWVTPPRYHGFAQAFVDAYCLPSLVFCLGHLCLPERPNHLLRRVRAAASATLNDSWSASAPSYMIAIQVFPLLVY